MQTEPVAPVGINHLVINVRNMAESHRFWTEIVGLKQVGAVRPRGDRGPTRTMQFYSADHDGQMSHHDVALMEYPELPAPAADGTLTSAIGHIAIAFPDREASAPPRISAEQGREVRAPRRTWHDPQPVHPRPERL